MTLNEVMWKHVQYRFRMWSGCGLLIGKREAFMNALAVIYWHLTIRYGEDFRCSSPEELAKALKAGGIPVETVRKGVAYRFTLDGVPFSLQPNEYFGGEATLSGVGWPENRCICNMIHMTPEAYVEFIQKFAKLFPEVEKKAGKLADAVNAETVAFMGDSASERVLELEHPDPVLDTWVIEENFRWGEKGQRLLVGIEKQPLVIT